MRRMLPVSLLCVVASFACVERSAPTALDEHRPAAARTTGATDPTAEWRFPLVDTDLGLRSDGLFPNTSESVYHDGVCGVAAKIFATTAASNSGDATMQTDNPKTSDRSCASYPRKVKIAYGDRIDVGTVFANTRAIVNTDSTIPIGTTAKRMLALTLSGTGLRCKDLRWTIQTQAAGFVNADQVLVTRIDLRTWQVATQPYPNDRAYCIDNAASYHLPVRFTIISDRDMP